jgi:predicted Zn-dependent protease
MTVICTSCSEVAITGRSQLNLIPNATMNSMALTEYNQFLKENKKSTDAANTAMVQRVGQKIADAVERYCRSHGLSDRVAGFNWEFNLIESKDINAWAMPGGKVVVYTGILPVTKDEAGLAVVIGHEVAHVIAQHGNERMSQGLLAEMGGMALSEAIASKPDATRNLFLKSYSLGANVGVLLPYSRLQESEADRMGLIFMAMADYDPQAAVGFWQRMAAQPGNNQKPPEFLSTHPADNTRIAGIRSYLPEAMSYYRSQGQAVQPVQSQPAQQQNNGWQSIIR